jgi:hypothetical protein
LRAYAGTSCCCCGAGRRIFFGAGGIVGRVVWATGVVGSMGGLLGSGRGGELWRFSGKIRFLNIFSSMLEKKRFKHAGKNVLSP